MNFTILSDALRQHYQDYKKRGSNMAQLAKDIGISKAMINFVLLGKRQPGAKTLHRLYHFSERMKQAVLFFFEDGVTEVAGNDTKKARKET